LEYHKENLVYRIRILSFLRDIPISFLQLLISNASYNRLFIAPVGAMRLCGILLNCAI